MFTCHSRNFRQPFLTLGGLRHFNFHSEHTNSGLIGGMYKINILHGPPFTVISPTRILYQTDCRALFGPIFYTVYIRSYHVHM